MGSSGRLLGSLQAPQAHLSKSLFVCSTCRQQFRPQTLRVATNYRNASGSTSFTEKVRRKIWGTDNPPGLKDPYGGEGFVEKALRKRRGEEEPEVEPEPQRERTHVETTPPEEYVPATTWEGLESVGQWWRTQPTEADHFQRFMTGKKLKSRDEITGALHQVMVELCLLRELDMPLSKISELKNYTEEEISIFSQVTITPSADKSSARVSFPKAEVRETLIAAFQRVPSAEEGASQTQEMLDSETVPNEAEEFEDSAATPKLNLVPAPPKNLDFLSLSLDDPETKFAVLKRASQITGYRIPDHAIFSMKSVSRLFHHLLDQSKPKPKKLAQNLSADKQLRSLPNVKIARQRVTPIHKEKEIGRWKVIEEELTRRGLPVTGNLRMGPPRYTSEH